MIEEPNTLGSGFEKFTSWRPEQRETVESLLNSNKRFLLLEAPTGSGKTLIGTALHKLSRLGGTVYCCTTKQLQNQYMEDFHTFAIDVKGRSNYPCLLPGIENASRCLESQDIVCDQKDKCPYRKRVEQARQAELACLNIWSLLFQIKFAERFTNNTFREDEPDRNLLILDEADTLEDTLVSFASCELTQKYCKKNHLPLPNFKETNVNYWSDWVQKSLHILDKLLDSTLSEEKENDLLSAKQNLKFLYSNLCNTWVVETEDGAESAKFVPTDISTLANQFIFNHFGRILLMSASFCGSKIYTQIMGIPENEYDYLSCPSYFPTHKRPIYYIPVANCTQKYEQQGAYSEIIKVVDKILETFNTEKTIIHTVSNKRLEQLQAQSKHSIKPYTAQDGKANMADFQNGNTRILASPSIERGFDFSDDACRINIVTKVPNPFWGSKSIQVRAKKNRQWYAWQAVQKIVQMTGRSTRNDSDYSLSFILDSDFENLVNGNPSKNRQGAGHLFPNWWKEGIQPIRPEDITKQLLENASK